jgi:hypothetical protein
MSFSAGSVLSTRRKEDFEKMAAYAIELTRDWSLKELGYDITLPDEERKEHRGFFVKDNVVHWYDHSAFYPKNIPVDVIIEQISKHFPDMELLYTGLYEGLREQECRIKNGVETETKRYCLGIYEEKEEDFRLLADIVQKKELQAQFFIERVIIKEDQQFLLLYFESLAKEEVDSVLTNIVKLFRVSACDCFLFENNDMGDSVKRKAHVKNGQVEWQDVPTVNDRPVFYQDYDSDNPFVEDITADFVKAIFPEK